MPLPTQDILDIPQLARITVQLEPAHNALQSLLLLVKAKHVSGFSDWVTQTAESLTEAEWHRHELVMIGFHFAVMPEQSWTSFPAYLDHLAAMSPSGLRDKLLDAYASLPLCVDESEGDVTAVPVYDKQMALKSVDDYLGFLRERFDEKHIDVELETQAYAYVMDPPSLHSLIVSHLRQMWEQYLAQEWERVKPMLQDAVRAFRTIDLSQINKVEAARTITGQDLDDPKWQKMLTSAERIVFIPNAHIGPYLGHVMMDDSLGVVFGARLPKGAEIEAPDLSRNEILVRLSALADDSRLRILKLVADKGEIRSQEIIQALDLSQSAASRHLTQLSASGYLFERRCEGAKCYSLNRDRIEETLLAISNFLQSSQQSG